MVLGQGGYLRSYRNTVCPLYLGYLSTTAAPPLALTCGACQARERGAEGGGGGQGHYRGADDDYGIVQLPLAGI